MKFTLREIGLALVIVLMLAVGLGAITGTAENTTDTTPTWSEAEPFYDVLMTQGVKYETGRPTKLETSVTVLSVLERYTGDVAVPRNRTESTFEIAVTTIYSVPIAFIPQL